MNHLMQWIVVYWIWLAAGSVSLTIILIWLVLDYKEANRICDEELRIAEWNRRVELMQERAKNVRYGRDSWAPEPDIEDSSELVQCKTGYIPLPDRDYSCGSSFCDDPACSIHGSKDADGQLLYWSKIDSAFEANHSEKGDLYDEAQ